MNNDKALKDFASQVSDAVGGGVVPHWFDRFMGLCSNLSNYMDSARLDYAERKALRSAFNTQIELHRKYSHEQYPFNLGVDDYLRGLEQDTVYKNAYRLKFLEVLKNKC